MSPPTTKPATEPPSGPSRRTCTGSPNTVDRRVVFPSEGRWRMRGRPPGPAVRPPVRGTVVVAGPRVGTSVDHAVLLIRGPLRNRRLAWSETHDIRGRTPERSLRHRQPAPGPPRVSLTDDAGVPCSCQRRLWSPSPAGWTRAERSSLLDGVRPPGVTPRAEPLHSSQRLPPSSAGPLTALGSLQRPDGNNSA